MSHRYFFTFIALLILLPLAIAAPLPAVLAVCDPNAVITRISVASDGTEGNFEALYLNTPEANPVFSADNRYVVFTSGASNLVANDNNNVADVFVHDRQTCVTSRVSVSSAGEEGDDYSTHPSISADGRYVAFVSHANNFADEDSFFTNEIYYHDRQTGQTIRVTPPPSQSTDFPMISADGNYIVFQSRSPYVSGDTNNNLDIFVYDRLTTQTTRVSVGSGDTLTDEVEKVLQNRRPSQLEEPFHDNNDYNASLSQMW